MTAAVLARPATPLGCPHSWCIQSSTCSVEDEPDEVRCHEGRRSSVKSTIAGELDVYPTEVDYPNGTPHSGPLVAISADETGQKFVELIPATALTFADALTSFASEGTPVGVTATFEGNETPDCLSGATVTIRRLDDVRYEYGNGAPRYIDFGAVEVSIHDPDGDPKPDVLGLSAPDAVHFACCVRACVAEVTR